VLSADEGQDRVRLAERRVALDGEDGQAAEGRARLTVGPLGAREAFVLEGDVGEEQREPALLATAAGEVEIRQLGLGMARVILLRALVLRSRAHRPA
jgi:hypothetical protein